MEFVPDRTAYVSCQENALYFDRSIVLGGEEDRAAPDYNRRKNCKRRNYGLAERVFDGLWEKPRTAMEIVVAPHNILYRPRI